MTYLYKAEGIKTAREQKLQKYPIFVKVHMFSILTSKAFEVLM